ncbi:MAG: autotransporter outer membrane beta-barrel domain-containing protein, partial [Enterobacteriaceae bacterium]|nr:autotransporter outer membrane beta-barrel domain-containing protein [Enterobacteriaceae bacterium]
MKLNKLVLALPALLAVSLSAYSAETFPPLPPESFAPEETTPDEASLKQGHDNGWTPENAETWKNQKDVHIRDNHYVAGEVISGKHVLYLHDNSHSLNNVIKDSANIRLNGDNQIVIGNKLDNGVLEVDGLSKGTKFYGTTLENNSSLLLHGIENEAYNTIIKSGSWMSLYGNFTYAKSTIIDGGTQHLWWMDEGIDNKIKAEDTLVINGGEQRVQGGMAKNTYVVGKGSYQWVSTYGGSDGTKVYSGAVQLISAVPGDINTIVYGDGLQYVWHGLSTGATIYGLQILSHYVASMENGKFETQAAYNAYGQPDILVKDAIIKAGGVQRIQMGTAENTQVHGLQIVSGRKGGWFDYQWKEMDTWNGFKQYAKNSTIYTGGKQQVEYYADAIGTIVDGGIQHVAEYGHSKDTIIKNGGSSYIAFGAYSSGALDIVNGSLTMQGGGVHHYTNASSTLGGKGAWAQNVNLQGANSTLYIEHSNNKTDGVEGEESNSNPELTESTITIWNLTNNGTVVMSQQKSGDIGRYNRLELKNLTGNGTFVMNTNVNGGIGDFLHISDSVNGNFNVKVLDSGHELRRARAVDSIDPHHLIYAKGSAAEHFALVDGSVDLGAYKYFLIQGDDDDSDNWYLSPTAKPVDPVKPDEKP